MATMTSYPHRVSNWLDLATTDLDASKAFYGALFGWEYDTRAVDGPSDCVTAQRKGHNAAGMMQLSPEMAASGMPPVWSTYVNVDDLDATIEKIEAEGGLDPAAMPTVASADRSMPGTLELDVFSLSLNVGDPRERRDNARIVPWDVRAQHAHVQPRADTADGTNRRLHRHPRRANKPSTMPASPSTVRSNPAAPAPARSP